MSSEASRALKYNAKVSELLISILEGDNNDVIKVLDDVLKYDTYTFQHCVRVFRYATLLGLETGLGDDELRDLGTAALLHDCGKIFIDISIINKAGKLTTVEYLKVKQHVFYGYYMLSELKFNERVLRYVVEHHEKDDGDGYPFNKTGEYISKCGRILSIADKFDAVTVKRVYQQKSMSIQEAISMLWNEPGLDYMTITKLANIV